VETIFEHENFLESVELSLFHDHTVCSCWRLILDHS